jgi:hypothetical protein
VELIVVDPWAAVYVIVLLAPLMTSIRVFVSVPPNVGAEPLTQFAVLVIVVFDEPFQVNVCASAVPAPPAPKSATANATAAGLVARANIVNNPFMRFMVVWQWRM